MGFRNLTTTLSEPAQWLIEWLRGGCESDSGVSVNGVSALSYPPVWYAVSKIAGHVGQLPLNTHKRLERGSEHAATHPIYHLLKTRPNEYQTAIVFKEQMMLHALLYGNARAAILRTGGVARELIPLVPGCTWTWLVDGKKWHIVDCRGQRDNLANDRKLGNLPRTQIEGGIYKIPDEDVLHVPGLGYDGITGYSLIQIAKDSMGLGLASQKASARSFRNGSKPSVIITVPPGQLREDKDAKEFLDNFNEHHEGVDNAGRAALLREGMTMSSVGMSASDSQWIEQRIFQRQDAALLFLLESILGDNDSVSYNSLEQKNLAYLSSCLMRWLVKWEQECDYKLLGRQNRTHFTKFNTAALLRSDYKTTIDSLSLAINARILNPNEAREKIDMNPYPGGEEFANPAITPGSPGDEEETEEEEETDPNNRALVSHFKHLIKTEANKVLFAAGNAGNYIHWLDNFYDQWTTKLTESVVNFGGEGAIAATHCERSYSELVEITGTVTQEGLAGAIEEVVSHWPDRAEQLATQIKDISNASV